MKKLSSIVLLLLYTMSISGLAIDSHFCCGELASVQIEYAPTHCAPSSDDGNGDCCKDISCFFKIHDVQYPTVLNFSFKTPVLNTPSLLLPVAFDFTKEQNASDYAYFHSPPPQTTLPLFIRHEVFLI